jgi:hypothetical protein
MQQCDCSVRALTTEIDRPCSNDTVLFLQLDGDAGKRGGSVHPQCRSYHNVARALSARPANLGYFTAVRRRLASVSTARTLIASKKTHLTMLKLSRHRRFHMAYSAVGIATGYGLDD